MTTKNLRKRPRVNYSTLEDITDESIESEVNNLKDRVIASNGKIFYPCKFCYKVFPKKVTSLSHMAKCPEKNKDPAVTSKSKVSVNNNELEEREHVEEANSDVNSTENKSPDRIIQSSINNDTSIYDYDEPDDNLEDKDPQDSKDENIKNRRCKHCSTLFENPMDLLRHNRDCHNFPRKILPPDEIEKYFDYPNREFCPICEKPIKTRNFRSVFVKHLLVHTSGLTHECSICKKKFRRRDHMRAHKKRHIVSA